MKNRLCIKEFLARRNLINIEAARCSSCNRFPKSTLQLLIHCHSSWCFGLELMNRISFWIHYIEESFTSTGYELNRG
ncbi:hypothetical protein NC652_016133 [Populus alba x Populus x berolinensis]|uniref:Uncharacterized protein n=1 Tax=Populus alba x Populus x berolinensis TaxID=444605 RepID=A0AAD6QM27_9ROSI|nr:hypothetical protein NC651_015628 [Populus alba x Populus x berolinensis]KAJ6922385.1 hypothetical protein NC652_016133 [Populus alba x Populus x berolinensis]KAJ6992890.1 hypothetical protein NC653_016105 [Populus alba x Populus x berolinensis]